MKVKITLVQLQQISHRIFLIFKDKSGSMEYPVRKKTTFVVKRVFSGERTATQAFLSLIEQDAALHSERGRGIMEPVNPIMPAASDKEVAQ
ncbi:MAG: hypothetical protein ABF904_13665 [Ethanoligenens sp.]